MKRDKNLIRLLLLEIEEQPAGIGAFQINLDGIEQMVVNEHLLIMESAGLIRCKAAHGAQGQPVMVAVQHLTSAGHDFLDASRSPTIWKAAMEKAGTQGLSLFIDVLKELAKTEIKRHTGLSL